MKFVIFPIVFFAVVGSAIAQADNHFWGHYNDAPVVKEGLLLAKQMEKPDPGLAKKYPAKNWTAFSIDLDQDGTPDYIVESKTDVKTCFVKSDLSIQSCEKLNYSKGDGFSYEYFFNPGKGKMLALFDFSGEEDSSDYFLKEFDSKTWKIKKVTEIFPIIDSQSKAYNGLYWGYPWDIHGFILSAVNDEMQFQATFKHQIESGQEGGTAKPKGPAILFSGVPTQGEPKGGFEKLRKNLIPMSIGDVERAATKK